MIFAFYVLLLFALHKLSTPYKKNCVITVHKNYYLLTLPVINAL